MKTITKNQRDDLRAGVNLFMETGDCDKLHDTVSQAEHIVFCFLYAKSQYDSDEVIELMEAIADNFPYN